MTPGALARRLGARALWALQDPIGFVLGLPGGPLRGVGAAAAVAATRAVGGARWSAYRAARAASEPRGAALRKAWPKTGRRPLGGPGIFAGPSGRAWRGWLARNDAPPPAAPGPPVAVARWEGATLAAPINAAVVLALEPGDRTAPWAEAVISAVFADPAVQLAYFDEDRLGPDGRCDPVLKTACDATRLSSQNYIGAAFAVRGELLREVGDYSGPDALVRRLAAAAGPEGVRHVPRVLRTAASAPAWPYVRQPAELPRPAPSVLAIVPTRDRPELLRRCVEGLLERTDYPGLRLVFVDNGSRDPGALALLDRLAGSPRTRVLRIDAPFDYAALNNAAAAGAEAELLAFLNDDVAADEPGWLAEMAALAVRPEVGAVGAKLLYPDGRIQHAGVSLGLGALGVAGHDFRSAPGDTPGPQGRLQVVREAAAVTGACLVVARSKFEAVGGFDPALKVAFNDVDLCLRLRARGWKTVWTPHARLIHLEGATRSPDITPEAAARLEAEAAFMRERWGPLLQADPYYHPALSLTGERFALARRPRSLAPR